MNNYIFFYFISSIISVYGGIGVFRKYRNLGGFFFFIYTILVATWLIFYFLFFSEYGFSESTRLIFSRICYGLSPITLICFLSFIYLFSKVDSGKPISYFMGKYKNLLLVVIILFIGIFYLSVFTDKVILSIALDDAGVYREQFGSLSWINNSIYLLFIPFASTIFWKRQKLLSYTDKIRISKIVWIKFMFLSTLIVLQVILPIYGIWILENEIILLFGLSVLIIANIIQRYYFSPIGYQLSKIFSTFVSLIIITFIIWGIIENNEIPETFFTHNFSSFVFVLAYASLVLGIAKLLGYIFDRFIFSKTQTYILEEKMKEVKKNMVQFLNFKSLNTYIQIELGGIFKIKGIELVRIERTKEREYLSRIFAGIHGKSIIDDFVFLEENSLQFDFKKISSGLDNPFLCVPIYYQKGKLMGLLLLEKKKFGDFYTLSEVNFLEDLSSILSIHMRYIDIYNQLEDISRNLDQKVDEKTIEYNTLISRQKEFIATLSHEIKAPLTSALLQIDNLSAEIENKQLSEVGIQEEVISIGENLAYTKTLLSQLFTTEYLEKNQAVLYPERVNIVELITSQYNIQKKVNLHCNYSSIVPKDPIYMNLDKTQFIQVITNLFTNATKFADKKNPEIYLEIEEDQGSVIVGIEDNGSGLDGIELDEIFEKYTIGKNSIGLGIGLYLCKRIVELHDGAITSKKGKKLSGIRIEIRIPIDQI